LRIQYFRPKDREVVAHKEMVKGYEVAKDSYVTLTPEELVAVRELPFQVSRHARIRPSFMSRPSSVALVPRPVDRDLPVDRAGNASEPRRSRSRLRDLEQLGGPTALQPPGGL
jgi:hypothetical protein